ncbi:MAG: Radical SAM domain protein [Candidatus Roizmanbacteria bacterium GW2011_GWA2_37_7]|uniref:Radical SAM domain protein n=1 Tax=Candidatus Roizmanbacteria bacterium GW2011_GWA2_37_7 TaxID=1618481 RepID=A0A0G0K8J9_9BACT|nr:MAG: Radical SAM domain protein [Candidatus Roizmanbacteria bacterium GW2011_GWA2_37_7]
MLLVIINSLQIERRCEIGYYARDNEPNYMLKEFTNYSEAIKGAIFPNMELRFVNWYLQHGCDLDCSYCKVPKQKVGIMSQEDRQEVIQKVRNLCSKQPIISLLGGEPTLRPDFLVEAVEDAANAGFLVNVVSNGWGLTPELIMRLGKAGLHYLGISVDSDRNTLKSNLGKALSLHATTRKFGILPVINTVVTSDTRSEDFKKFAGEVIRAGCFISPLACSPEVPGGAFSSAQQDLVPSQQQLRAIIPWLAWKKLTTGLITSDFNYLWTLYNSGASSDEVNLWHCASHFRLERY